MTPKSADSMRVLEMLTAKGWIVQLRREGRKAYAHARRASGLVASFESQGASVPEAIASLLETIKIVQPEHS